MLFILYWLILNRLLQNCRKTHFDKLANDITMRPMSITHAEKVHGITGALVKVSLKNEAILVFLNSWFYPDFCWKSVFCNHVFILIFWIISVAFHRTYDIFSSNSYRAICSFDLYFRHFLSVTIYKLIIQRFWDNWFLNSMHVQIY